VGGEKHGNTSSNLCAHRLVLGSIYQLFYPKKRKKEKHNFCLHEHSDSGLGLSRRVPYPGTFSLYPNRQVLKDFNLLGLRISPVSYNPILNIKTLGKFW
jgi:hypothetical protein